MNELDLPPFSLDVETLDLGPGVKAIGLELVETESREPVRGPNAVAIWSEVFPALVNREPFLLDFFSHLDRVRDFCNARKISFREAAGRCIVIPEPSKEQLHDLLERFEGETFGLRAGAATKEPDSLLEGDLSKRGLDAYQAAYTRYTFCVVCELEDAWLTILSETLWPSEAVRRVRPAVQPFDVHIARPN
ncbi:MAG TPA: hypothetical protein VFP96_15885 [Candidatus Acidoferrum sp.]|nr:hypothetical protein [Candidatus Acidoferrum sp.]